MKKFNFTSHEEVPGWVRDYLDTVADKPFFLLPIEEVNQFLNELDEFESSRPAYKMASQLSWIEQQTSNLQVLSSNLREVANGE